MKPLSLPKAWSSSAFCCSWCRWRVAHRRRGRRRAAGVAQLLAFEHVLVDVVLHEEPGALVLRLVLAPHHLGGVGVALHLGGEGLVRERVELLDAHDGHVPGLLLVALLDQVVVDLARAGDDALDLVGFDLGAARADHGLELALGEVAQRRRGVLVAQQALGREDDQRLAELAHHLPAQQVEDLAGLVGCTTCMLLSAASCMKRSRRAELCSGPWPS
jgi:hypothetical protein